MSDLSGRNAKPEPARQKSMRKLAGALVLAVALAACSSPDGGAPAGAHVAGRIGSAVQFVADVRPAAPDAGAGQPVAAAEQRFTFALLRQLGSQDKNVTVSPSSLAMALTMLENGATGTTRAQIAAALQASHLSLERQNAGWRALTENWSQAANTGNFALQSANAVWTQRGFPVRPSYLDSLARDYATGIWRADFAEHNADALNAINDWTKRQTNGKITKLFGQLDPSTLLVLANAVYFKAQWVTKFDKHDTARGRFTTPGGSTIEAQMMHDSELSARAASTSAYQAVELPYKGGRFAALAIMPTSGSLPAFTSSLTPDRLAQIESSLRRQPIDLTMPRFATTSTLDLPQTLQALGMRDAFGGAADFSAMSPAARRVGLMVGQVVQRDYLSVTEAGTEAAAATGIQMVPSAAPVMTPIHLDHPFLFLIRDGKTGAVLFASQINDPAEG